ncbi:MAG TPA: hypothetical protein VH815_10965, partial [Acidobacteriota bacterium]
LHRGMFGMAKPEFGPFSTIDLNKVDSPVLRKKTKEGSYTEASYDLGQGWDWDFSKYETVEKRKAYNMLVASESDTAELLFSIYRISHEKNLTFFGELMSKDDDGKNVMLGYKTNISGIISTGNDSLPWRFFIEDSFGRRENTTFQKVSRITTFFLVTPDDSLFTEPIISTAGLPGSKFSWETQGGVLVKSAKGETVAAAKFGTPGDVSNPFYTWIRNDLEKSQQHAIAAVLALLISARSGNN